MHTEKVLRALRAERDFVAQGIGYTVVSARRDEANMVFALEPRRGGRSSAVDDSLEGCRALWGEQGEGRGEVIYVNSDEGEIVLRFCIGELPETGSSIRLFQRDFLSPLIELWCNEERRARALKLPRRDGTETVGTKPAALSKRFSELRERQREAVEVADRRAVLLIGPPGTGKTYTIGAVIANLVRRFKDSRIIVTGPTNVAVDGAIIAADQWLERIGRSDLRQSLKRLGAWFDPKKYAEHQHLLAAGVYEAATRLSLLELEEPSRSNVQAYVRWKSSVEQARKELRANLDEVLSGTRVVAATTATLAQWYDALEASGRWHFVVCDEASQIPFPMAWMIGATANRTFFAGDPNQLAPVVQNPDAAPVLNETAFDTLPRATRVQLDEQSRMCPAICSAVADVFYGGKLRVCSRARKKREWSSERSPIYIDGRELPRIFFEMVSKPGEWSTKYNGLIRYESAVVTRDLAESALGSYVDPDQILVLTPFRAQRALLRKLFSRGPLRDVKISTVHRAQGSESTLVIFDPVAASKPFLNSADGRRLINVAVSRAKAHVAMVAHAEDFANPWVSHLHKISRSLWHKPGQYTNAFAVKRSKTPLPA